VGPNAAIPVARPHSIVELFDFERRNEHEHRVVLPAAATAATATAVANDDRVRFPFEFGASKPFVGGGPVRDAPHQRTRGDQPCAPRLLFRAYIHLCAYIDAYIHLLVEAYIHFLPPYIRLSQSTN
jgi:hypothetical protein